MAAPLTLIRDHVSFAGTVGFYSHPSVTCNSEMKFAVYVPPQARSESVPVLYFLSGLTCNEENFIIKAGAQQFAAEAGLMLVAPDTSPRNTDIVNADRDWDLGTGAGFYVDATAEPWRSHYQMYSYITQELPALMAANFPVKTDRQGITGHSMGGHGALVCALRNRDRYQSVSAFAPIVAPTRCPWGHKAFANYLGADQTRWSAYDASTLILAAKWQRPILIDQGLADPFLDNQLMPQVFETACAQVEQPLTLRLHAGYDHSYYFIATFMADHIKYHAELLWG
jgi:S-formylglutathione hydrolase